MKLIIWQEIIIPLARLIDRLMKTSLYYSYCLIKCSCCNGSGFELLENNDIKDCSYCNGDGCIEKGYWIKIK